MPFIDSMRMALEVATSYFTIIAAVYWGLSARVGTPTDFTIYVVRPSIGPAFSPLDGKYVGHAYSQELVELADALRRQSLLSKRAAIAASIAAVSLTFVTLLDLLHPTK